MPFVMNVVTIAKIVTLFTVIITIFVTVWLSQPAREDLVEAGGRSARVKQIEMWTLNAIVKANSNDLPDRPSSLSARELCKMRNNCLPKFRKFETMLRVSPKYNMVNCVVPKTMSKVLTAAMCYLYDEKGYIDSGRKFDDEYTSSFCKEKNEFTEVNDVRDAYNISVINTNWSFSMVTRDPIDRFVSNFIDRCVRIKPANESSPNQCNQCGLNMTCFIEREYNRLISISYDSKIKQTQQDTLFFPQIWHCGLNNELDAFEILRYSKDAEEMLIPQLDDLLQRQNVPHESRKFIRQQLLHRNLNHSTVETVARRFYYSRLLNSPYLLEYIVKIFYYDFLQFHYDFPEGFD